MASNRRIATAAVVALCAGLTAVVVLQGFSPDPTVKALETLAIVGVVGAVLFGSAMAVGLRLADWRDPESEEDFEQVVLRAERLAREGVAAEGRRRRAYGLYHGDGATRDDVPDRIVIYRDTLRRDFGHDPELLRDQVTRTVRHELAHHVGFDELGVRDLGL